jgi:hypothetical protein
MPASTPAFGDAGHIAPADPPTNRAYERGDMPTGAARDDPPGVYAGDDAPSAATSCTVGRPSHVLPDPCDPSPGTPAGDESEDPDAVKPAVCVSDVSGTVVNAPAPAPRRAAPELPLPWATAAAPMDTAR